MILLAILKYILLFIAFCILLIVMVPYGYSVKGQKFETGYIRGTLSWLFGGLRISFQKHFPGNAEARITFLGLTKKITMNRDSDNENPSEEEKSGKRRKKSSLGKYLAREPRRKIISGIVKIIRHLKPRTFYINARVGFDDPSNAGFLWAVKGVLSSFFKRHHIKIEPVFDEEVLEGRFLIKGRMWLPYVILVFAGTLLSKPFRNIYVSNLKVKFKGGT